MQAKSRARIGIVGTGWWSTETHIPSLLDYPPAELVAICDRNVERLNQAGDVYDIARRYSDVDTMLDNEQLDGVIIATNHTTHYPVARAVLQRGLGAMIEKPMVLHAAEARELLQLAEQHDLPLVIGYPWHYVPQYQHLRSLLASGCIGEIQMVTTLFASRVLEFYRANPEAYRPESGWRVTGPTPATYSDPALAGGGQGHLQLTHAAGLLFWLTGLQAAGVAAFMENFGLNVDLCDAISVRFQNSTIGTLASTGAIPAHQPGQLEYRIYGSDGFILFDPMAGRSQIFTADGRQTSLDPVPPEQTYPRELTSRNLVDLLLGNGENHSPAIYGVRTVELLEAAYRSATEQHFVDIDELYPPV